MSALVDRVHPASRNDAEPPADLPGRELSLWLLFMVFAGVALAATLTSSPGVWIADARLEFTTDPTGFLAGHQYFWDETRGMGNTVTWFSPVLGTYQALVSVFVSDIWIIQRLVHTLLLTTAAMSMAILVRVVKPRVSWLHLVAGLVYAFNPYTSQFLLPSGLFLSFAISPLLLAAFLRGVTVRSEAWRTAALFALAVFSVGALNTAALVYAGLPMVIGLVYVVLIERSTSWAAVGGWVGRAVLLTIGVSAAALAVLWLQRGDVALNLTTTERPTVVSGRSSWAESWRGLGMWLTYYRDVYGPLRPQAAPYFENWWVVIASYAAPTAAAVVLVLSRWRPRYFFGALFSLGVLVMVGLWPVESPSPFGRVLSWSFENAVLLRGLRTTYKAGAVFYIGVAALAAVAVVWGLRGQPGGVVARAGRTRTSLAVSGVLAVGLVVAAVPFWTGGLYNANDGFDEVPNYWSEALGWLNAQPEDGRVMVLPGVIRARYRWGYINDNLFHGLLDKSLVTQQAIPPPGTPVAADVIRSLDEYIASSSFVPDSLGPILRRLGVRWVLFQNDLEWQQLDVGRPTSYDDVKSDPALRPVISFGGSGQNTTASGDPTAAALGENGLAPVEIYEVTDASNIIRFSPEPELVVSGGGDSWPQLSLAGLLDGGPLAYSSLMTDEELADAVAGSSQVVVTDGARRRALQVRTGRMLMSHTLGPEEQFYRAAVSPFPIDGQSMTYFPDAVTIEATVVGRGILPFDPAIRPALAFDQRVDTAWSVSGPEAEGATIEVELKAPTSIEQVRVLPLVETADRYAQSISLEVDLADGNTARFVASVDADSVGLPVSIDANVSDVVAFRLALGNLVGIDVVPLGIAEVEVTTPDGDLDLREFIQSPRDLREAASRSPAVAEALAAADVSFSFSRYVGTRAADEEVDIRRLFWSPRDISSELTGTARLTASTPNETVDHLLAGEVGAISPDPSDSLDGWAANAVDGDLTTAWMPGASADASLIVRPPSRPLQRISVVTDVSTGSAPFEGVFSAVDDLRLVVDSGDGAEVVDTTAGPIRCAGEGESRRCSRTFDADVATRSYNLIEVEILDVSPQIGTFAIRPIAIAEVLFDGESATSDDWGLECVDGFVINGQPVAIRLDASPDRLLAGESVPFTSCTDVVISAGDASLESVPELSGAVSDVLIGAATIASASRGVEYAPSEVRVLERSPTRVVVSVSSSAPGTLVGPGSFHPGWRAFVGGEPLGTALPRDAQSSWVLNVGNRSSNAGADVVVTLEFRPQRTYEFALAISIGTVALALALVIGGRRRKTT